MIIIRTVYYIKRDFIMGKLYVIGKIISHSVINADGDNILRYGEYACEIFIVNIYDDSA